MLEKKYFWCNSVSLSFLLDLYLHLSFPFLAAPSLVLQMPGFSLCSMPMSYKRSSIFTDYAFISLSHSKLHLSVKILQLCLTWACWPLLDFTRCWFNGCVSDFSCGHLEPSEASWNLLILVDLPWFFCSKKLHFWNITRFFFFNKMYLKVFPFISSFNLKYLPVPSDDPKHVICNLPHKVFS